MLAIARFHGNVRNELRAAQRVRARRGVLLLVVLSMLVLFMLVGTAFLMSSSQTAKDIKSIREKPIAFATTVRGWLDRHCWISSATPKTPTRSCATTACFAICTAPMAFRRRSSATYARQISVDNTKLGATNGQFIDIYVIPLHPHRCHHTPTVG